MFRGELYILLATFLWAIDTLFRYPLTSEGLAASKIIASEHFFLCLLFFSYYFISKKWNKNFFKIVKKYHWSFFLIGAMGSALATWSFTKAFEFLNPSIVILLQKFQPIVAITLARLVLKESFSFKFWPWTILCFLGGALISYKDIQNVFDVNHFNSSAMKGYFYVFIAVLSWGAAPVYAKKLLNSGMEEKDLLLGRFFVGFLFSILILIFDKIFFNASFYVLNMTQFKSLFTMVLLSGVLGMFFYYHGVKLVEARFCTLLEMSFSFFAVLINWAFLDIPLEKIQIWGGILLLLGATMVQVPMSIFIPKKES